MHRILVAIACVLQACSAVDAPPPPRDGDDEVAGEGEGEGEAEGEGEGEGEPPSAIPFVFVVAMENKPTDRIYGNAAAPFINDVLRAEHASANSYADLLPTLVSEPHYVWLEAGTNAFDDHTFLSNADPSKTNSTADTRHIATQLANEGRSWRSYQEGLSDVTGACPIHTSGFYAPKHNPFIFFQDVSGNPPAENNATCAAHHRAYSATRFQEDLAAGDVEAYTFISPDVCNDMHGHPACENGCTSASALACISEGDAWLEKNAPAIMEFIETNGGVLFIVWDESEGLAMQPFLVIGPGVKPGHKSTVAYDHSSYVKSLQLIFGLPVDERVSGANDFGDLFAEGEFP